VDLCHRVTLPSFNRILSLVGRIQPGYLKSTSTFPASPEWKAMF
jgi:hypothetical protein